MSPREPIAITGMAVNTPLGDTLDGFLSALLAGRSAVSAWKGIDTTRICSKIGADLSDYDVGARIASFEPRVPREVHRRLRRVTRKLPWNTRLSVVMALDAALDAGLLASPIDFERVAVIVAGHNLNCAYIFDTQLQFLKEPTHIDALSVLLALDTDHAGCVSELLGARGPIHTTGGACASGNVALRTAVDEIRHHDVDAAVVVGPVLDFSPLDLQAMALIGGLSITSFNDEPERASRPWDVRREGFVPAHGGGVIVLERSTAARARGATIHGEILAVEANADGSHYPQPSEEGQTRLMRRTLDAAGLEPSQIDYVNAHATSTPVGDLVEIRSIKRAFGDHAARLKINATKSMLGHTYCAASIVETIAGVLQMRAGRLHPSINLDEPDPEVDLDVCRDGPVDHPVRHFMKTSFGFGGINCVSIVRRADAPA